MDQRILYLGDTALDRAGSYLAGILHHTKVQFNYIPSDKTFSDEWLTESVDAVVISDYPSAHFTESQLAHLARCVQQGTGLLMIGGWESFTGCAGGYQKTVLKEVLPVQMSDTDDRVNCAAPCVIRQQCEHPIIESVPFQSSPPCIAGYNRFTAKTAAQTVLSVDKYRVIDGDSGISFFREQSDPILVVGDYGKGRIGAYAGDVAPHWAGGFVDWGDERITLKAPGAGEVEIGNWYVRFFSNLIRWVCQ